MTAPALPAGGDTMLTVSDLARRLRAAHKTVARRQTAMHEAKAGLLELVAEARGQGWSYDRLALELGVTKARAQQLVKDLERRAAP